MTKHSIAMDTPPRSVSKSYDVYDLLTNLTSATTPSPKRNKKNMSPLDVYDPPQKLTHDSG